MFPFSNRLRWLAANKYLHTVEATEDHLELFHEPYRTVAFKRVKSMRVGLRVRNVLLVLLYPPLIGLIAGWVAKRIPSFEDVEETIQALVRLATTLSLIIGAAFLLITRYVEQLQADLHACMALSGPGVGGLRTQSDDENDD